MAIVKYANGGTNLAVLWKAGGDATEVGDGSEYVTFQQTVNAGLVSLAVRFPNATLERAGMLWVQGETDTENAGHTAAYEANLTAFIADVRATYGSGLPFYVSRLSSSQTALNAGRLASIRAAQEAVAGADHRTFLIDMDGFGMKSDNLHFNAAGQQSLGQAAAWESAYALWMSDHFTEAEITAGLGAKSADPDGDGQSNEKEFLGSSDPRDATDQFDCDLKLNGSGDLVIEYDSSNKRLYAVELLNPTTLVWDEELPDLLGTGGVVQRGVPEGLDVGLFRVRSSLP